MKAPSRPWLFQEESVGRRGGKDQKDSMRIQLLGHLTDQAWGCGNWKQKMMKSGCIALVASWKHLQTTGGAEGGQAVNCEDPVEPIQVNQEKSG